MVCCTPHAYYTPANGQGRRGRASQRAPVSAKKPVVNEVVRQYASRNPLPTGTVVSKALTQRCNATHTDSNRRKPSSVLPWALSSAKRKGRTWAKESASTSLSTELASGCSVQVRFYMQSLHVKPKCEGFLANLPAAARRQMKRLGNKLQLTTTVRTTNNMPVVWSKSSRQPSTRPCPFRVLRVAREACVARLARWL